MPYHNSKKIPDKYKNYCDICKIFFDTLSELFAHKKKDKEHMKKWKPILEGKVALIK